MERIKVRKWWWAWQCEMIETWLEEMAMEGFMLSEVTRMGEEFHFYKAIPKKIRYCIDYQAPITPVYKQILEEDGWAYINIPGNWLVCFKEYEDTKPELFNDYDSIIDRNKRLIALLFMLAMPAIYFPFFILNSSAAATLYVIPICLFFIGIIAFYAFAFKNLYTMNKALKLKKDIQNK